MADKKEERYTLMGPGGKISAIVMEAGEFNLFGNSCTTIITRETDKYPVIPDEPGKLEVVDNTDLMSGIGHGIANGLLMGAGVALFAGLTAATGGATLIFAGFLLGGASFGVSAATDGMVESDRETGNDRSWGDFALGLAGGGAAGATTGAILYGTVMVAPVAGMAAGMDAAAVLGPSAFTTTVVPAIITGGGYGLAGATALYTENDIRARNGGYNLLLDKVFHNNVDRYEECGLFLTYANGVYAEYGTTNMYRMPGGNSRQSLSNNQSVQKLKAQNSQSGTGEGNGGSGGGASLNGTGGKTGVLFDQATEPVAAGPALVQQGKGYDLKEAATKISPMEGYTDVVVHGTPDSFGVWHNGKWVYIDQRSLANYLKNHPEYRGGQVRLISCSTGANPNGIAQQLSNKLGVNVLAPSDTLYIYPNGTIVIGPNPYNNTGTWEQFTPGKH